MGTSDIPGARPDVYKRLRHLEGREYLSVKDITGAQPFTRKFNRGHDFKLYTKDIAPERWVSKRSVNP